MPPATDSISPTRPSARLARALDSERDTLARKLRRLEHDRGQLRDRLSAIEREIQAADERLMLLAQLRGEGDPFDRQRTFVDGRRLLEGPAIRMTAVALVRDLPQADEALHYRRWLELVEQAGFEVGGQKPPATFLSQINRSPVVRRTTRPGHYEIDRHAPARLRRRLAAMRERLSNGYLAGEDLVELEGVRQRRDALVREIDKTERALAEATAALTLPIGHLTRSA